MSGTNFPKNNDNILIEELRPRELENGYRYVLKYVITQNLIKIRQNDAFRANSTFSPKIVDFQRFSTNIDNIFSPRTIAELSPRICPSKKDDLNIKTRSSFLKKASSFSTFQRNLTKLSPSSPIGLISSVHHKT